MKKSTKIGIGAGVGLALGAITTAIVAGVKGHNDEAEYVEFDDDFEFEDEDVVDTPEIETED